MFFFSPSKKFIFFYTILGFFIFLFLLFSIRSLYSIFSYEKGSIGEVNPENMTRLEDMPKYIVIFGASVNSNQGLSGILKKRMDAGIAWSQKYHYRVPLLLTGMGSAVDKGITQYSEVDAMQKYALQQGIPAESIIIDSAGISTMCSLTSLKYFLDLDTDKVFLISSPFHLARIKMIAEDMGIQALYFPDSEEHFSLFLLMREWLAYMYYAISYVFLGQSCILPSS